MYAVKKFVVNLKSLLALMLLRSSSISHVNLSRVNEYECNSTLKTLLYCNTHLGKDSLSAEHGQKVDENDFCFTMFNGCKKTTVNACIILGSTIC